MGAAQPPNENLDTISGLVSMLQRSRASIYRDVKAGSRQGRHSAGRSRRGEAFGDPTLMRAQRDTGEGHAEGDR